MAAALAAAKVAVPTASLAKGEGGSAEGAAAASLGRMLSRMLLLAFTKWAFPSIIDKDMQASSRCSTDAKALKSNHKLEHHSMSPSSAA